nr:hypothetical protein [Kibdelosporangium sp. MJ126-NF4]CEL14596.1 hypothetical protein [Kibdelosporangium sp. MJ126-NF4]CTQ96776.1 hypothetical protein [Kibdelosporangium sp. MJ126-NF4]
MMLVNVRSGNALGLGSGVILPDGWILTNHVVIGASQVTSGIVSALTVT